MMREVEDDKLKQKEYAMEERLEVQRDQLKKRFAAEQARDLPIDFNAAEKNRKKFEEVFMKQSAQEGEGAKDKEDMDTIEKEFGIEAAFGKKKVQPTPAAHVNDSQGNPSLASIEAGEAGNQNNNYRQKMIEIENQGKASLDEIKKRQQRNIESQMNLDQDYRPQVISGAPVQGYGLNRGRSAKPAVDLQKPQGHVPARYESDADLKGALDRLGQARKDYLPRPEDVLPFLPTAKQIAENQAVRNVKEEMLMMRGHVLTSFQKMRNDLENLQTDVATGGARFKYAQAEFQDNLKREMHSRNNQVVDVLDHIRQWNPNQAVLPQDQQFSHKTLQKVPGFTIPQLNFEAATLEIKQRLEAMRNPQAFQNSAAQKIGILATSSTAQFKPSEYIKAESISSGRLMINPQSRYLVEAIAEEMNRIEYLRQFNPGVAGTKNREVPRMSSTPSEKSRASSTNLPAVDTRAKPSAKDAKDLKFSDTFERDGKKLDHGLEEDEINDEVGNLEQAEEEQDEVEDLANIEGEEEQQGQEEQQGEEEQEQVAGEEEQPEPEPVPAANSQPKKRS